MNSKIFAAITARQAAAIVAVLLATALLTILLRDSVRESIVLPLTLMTWALGILLGMLPQSVLLGALVFAAAVIGVRGIMGVKSPDTRPAAPAPQALSPSRLGQLSRLCAQLDYSAFAGERLSTELRGMVLAVLASEERQHPDEIVKRVRSGALAVPEHIHALLVNQPDWFAGSTMDPLEVILERIAEWLRARLRLKRPQGSAPAQLESRMNVDAVTEIVTWLEAKTGHTPA